MQAMLHISSCCECCAGRDFSMVQAIEVLWLDCRRCKGQGQGWRWEEEG
jgi:hypothetical protein